MRRFLAPNEPAKVIAACRTPAFFEGAPQGLLDRRHQRASPQLRTSASARSDRHPTERSRLKADVRDFVPHGAATKPSVHPGRPLGSIPAKTARPRWSLARTLGRGADAIHPANNSGDAPGGGNVADSMWSRLSERGHRTSTRASRGQ